MLTAITRKVSPALGRCALEYLPRQEIDIANASQQHQRYEACLADAGLHVISLPPEPDLPDSMFVEDPAVVVDEVAVIARMGNEARRGESASIAQALSSYRLLRSMREPATLEGGDILRIGRQIFAGISNRTNAAGVGQLASELEPFGYTVVPVQVNRCLHLKSGCCYLGAGMVLANREWIDTAPFRDFRIVDVASGEPGASNVLALSDTILIPASCPRTAGILERLGFKVQALDISELMKAEAGLTCSSLIFES